MRGGKCGFGVRNIVCVYVSVGVGEGGGGCVRVIVYRSAYVRGEETVQAKTT